MRRALGAILAGWAVLLGLEWLIERPLLGWGAAWWGPAWLATVRLACGCGVLTAAGWVIGRLHRPAPVWAALGFATTLSFWDLDPWLSLNVPWVLQLAYDTLRSSAYLESFVSTVFTHVLLFGCLFWGAQLSRPPAAPLSISA